MRLWLLALTTSLALAAVSPATAQTRIDLSSPDSVMASLQDLAGRWTHPQFVELLRAAILVHLPDYGDDPESFQHGRNRWALLTEGVLLSMAVLIQAPLVLEGEPFLRHLEAEKVEPWLHEFLRQALEGRTVEALVELGRDRERGMNEGSSGLWRRWSFWISACGCLKEPSRSCRARSNAHWSRASISAPNKP